MKFNFELKNNFLDESDLMIVKDESGNKIASFYYNMTGFVADFDLSDKEGVIYTFYERAASTQIREFKKALKQGFVNIKNYDN